MDALTETGKLEIALPGSFEKLPSSLKMAVFENPKIFGVEEAIVTKETHFSWIVMVGSGVYKIKKPFSKRHIDFSTLAKRKRHCQQEILLNQRFSSGVYLGMKALRIDLKGRFYVTEPWFVENHPPRLVEWMIHMRRLDDCSSMDFLLSEGCLSSRQMEQLVDRLGACFSRAPVISLSPERYVDGLAREIHECVQAFHVGPPEAKIGELLGCELSHCLSRLEQDLGRRAYFGKIVEGHGDLRPEHIFFEPEVQIIDGLEFSYALRCRDVLDEMAYLAVECEALGHKEVADEVTSVFGHMWDRQVSPHLEHFYGAFRALVRAKLATWRYVDSTDGKRLHWLDLIRMFLRIAEGRLGTL